MLPSDETKNTISSQLDLLSIEAHRLRSLFDDRQEGIFTWWIALKTTLDRIDEIKSKIGIE